MIQCNVTSFIRSICCLKNLALSISLWSASLHVVCLPYKVFTFKLVQPVLLVLQFFPAVRYSLFFFFLFLSIYLFLFLSLSPTDFLAFFVYTTCNDCIVHFTRTPCSTQSRFAH